MDVVLLQPFLHARGGLEKVVMEIARRYNPVIYTYRYVPDNTFAEFKQFDIRIVKPQITIPASVLSERVKWAIQSGEAFYSLKVKDDYDVINAHGTPSEWARNRNARMLWYCHTPNREAFDLYEWRMRQRGVIGKAVFWASIQFYKHFEREVVPKIEKIVTNSKNSQARIRKYLNRDSDIISPGITVSNYKNNGYKKYFFYPSRITPEKRFELAIEAFRKSGLHSKGYKLVIAGSLIPGRSEHEAYLHKIKQLIDGLGEIRVNVPYLELLELYSNCTAVLFTPVDEDFGIVPLEAMASEKPVVAVDEGGPRETILHEKTGFLCKSTDEMATCMGLLASDITLVEKMGRAGRKHVAQNFTWDLFFREFDKALRDVAKMG
ncbi:MAG: glycosyltransferase family 4 protein [Candidatus Micrarchaeota archaeon]|nr:glycosyltransferase family 4 protein [Candidatus Micrarchaeota archaeon]